MATHSSVDEDERQSLQAKTAAAGYSARVSEVVQQIPTAADESEAVSLLDEAAGYLGADVAAFVSFVRDDGMHESYRFLLACDPVWCHEYEQRAWYANDPWLGYALSHSEPIRASDIPICSGHERAVVELAADFGFRSAVIVPAPSSGGLTRLGVLCLGSSANGYFEGDGFGPLKVAARGLAMELHEWWIAHIKRELIAQSRIDDDDLVLLQCERRGCSTKAIAAELGISTGSINSRFQRMIQKLGVPNRKAAATMAAEYGLI